MLLLIGAMTAFGCAFSAPGYQGPKSDHFDGVRFHNDRPALEQGFGAFVKWVGSRKPGPWRAYQEFPPGPPPPYRVGDGELRVTFVNHSTVLIQLDGLNILTDPIWSERCSPVSFAGPARVRPPGIRFEDLPPIDVVLISHSHYDHLDVPTLRKLQHAFRRGPRIFSGLGNSLFLEQARVRRAKDLDWWQSVDLGHGVKLTAVPAQHFSNRGLFDRMQTLWSGFVLQGRGGSVYFAGDTGYGPHFTQIRERLGSPTVALLPIGAYEPRWFMGPVHTAPEEAVKAHQDLGARHSVAIHFGTFRMADDGQDEPVETLRADLAAKQLGDDVFWVLGFGEGRDVR